MFFNTRRRQNAIIARLESVLAHATFSVNDDGVMHLQPNVAVLDGAALQTIAGLARAACDDETIREVNIDMSQVSDVGPQFTVMFASLMKLARSLNAKCRVVGLQGKAAAAASLYRTSRELMWLLTPKAA